MKARRKMLMENLSYAFLAQGVSLLLNLLVSLVIPRVFGVGDFDFWQLFIFFTSYGGFLHLGLNDGIYLRFGGKNYDELDHGTLGVQMRISLLFQILMGILIVLISMLFVSDTNRIFVIIMAVLYSIVSNVSMFLGFVFRATNQIKVFSKSNLIYSIFLIVTISGILLLRISSLQLLVLLYVLSRVVSFVYLVIQGREIVFSKRGNVKHSFKELLFNTKSGFSLMMALTMGTLIVGIGRLFIDSHWGIEAFGQVSFALLLTKLFLVFVNQISFVIFPILRRVEESEQRTFYLKAHRLLTLILPLTLFAYLPLQVFIRMWLPAYEESLTFIGLLLPLCLFEGKMKMLSSTYFKLLRKEKSLLKINVLCACLSLILSLIGTYVFNRITIVVTFMTIALVIRSVLSEVYVSKQLNVSVYKQAFSEISLALVFVASTSFLATTQGMIVFLMAYVVYVILSKRVILRRVLQP